jgi:hypothetical protein
MTKEDRSETKTMLGKRDAMGMYGESIHSN